MYWLWIVADCHFECHFPLDTEEYTSVLGSFMAQENIFNSFESKTPACS